MKLSLVYIYPANDGPKHTDYALRFVCTYHEYPPMVEHETIVVLNGARTNGVCKCMFSTLPNVTFCEHDDSGWDIGGYQVAARQTDSEMMFCVGGPTYFRRAGWLKRIVDCYNAHGPGMYGTMASNQCHPHLRTTGFGITTKFLREYPIKVVTKEQRYEFEHGKSSITRLTLLRKKPCLLVTWDGVYPWNIWRKAPNAYHSGNQSNCLCYDNHSDTFDRAGATDKRSLWQTANAT